ncbi:hypothetical protein Pcinc_003193 [Petrolisthes cinctipes]|uniref:CCHC-type domain-containing protein n=1 Tax=Petrolisthes cinctipes TaxID=88211 RepID=A0AAE1GJW7_PETCI|nr:hypothetical protein Pcinc_003193 [Petrolisthes cinctipes]
MDDIKNLYDEGELLGYKGEEILAWALLRAYDVTAEGCRRNFRNAKFSVGESAEQLVCKLKKLFSRWVKADGCGETVEGLTDLFIREQFIRQYPQALTIFLKERQVICLQDCVREADGWIDAHGHPSTVTFTKNKKLSLEGKETEGKVITSPPRFTSVFSKDKAKFKAGNEGCWTCGKPDHKKVKCPVIKEKQTSAAASSGAASNSVRHEREVKNLILGKRKVGNQSVETMLDGGSTMCVVAERLVTLNQYTGNTMELILVNGSVVVMPEAEIYVRTPWYSGKVFSAVCRSPVFDLVVGGITDAQQNGTQSQIRKQEQDESSEQTTPILEQGSDEELSIIQNTEGDYSKRNEEVRDETTKVTVAAVVTRARSQLCEKAMKPFKVSDT